MHWETIAWIVIVVLAILVMARCCGGTIGGMRRGCGMPRRNNKDERLTKGPESGKAA